MSRPLTFLEVVKLNEYRSAFVARDVLDSLADAWQRDDAGKAARLIRFCDEKVSKLQAGLQRHGGRSLSCR